MENFFLSNGLKYIVQKLVVQKIESGKVRKLGASCNGKCVMYKKKYRRDRPNLGQGGLPYLTHGFCRTCEVWILNGQGFSFHIGTAKNRCPCCHTMMSFQPRQSRHKKKYRRLRELKNEV